MKFPLRPLQTRNHEPVTKPYGSQTVNNSSAANPPSYPDVILISTDDDFQSDNAELTRQAQHHGLHVETIMFETKNGSDLRKKIQQLHRHHKLGPDTQVLISLHGGVDKKGVHRLSGSRDNFFVTTRLLELLRKPPPGCPLQKWNGNIHINACEIGHLRKDLAQETGSYFLYGGKKETLTFDGVETFLNLFRLIGESKKNKLEDQTYPGISAEELFYEAANFSGETVSLHKDQQSWVSNATAPITRNSNINKEQIALQAQRALRSRLDRSRIEKVEIILKRIDKNLINDDWGGEAAIHAAANSEINPIEKIGLLLGSGADVNALDINGNTPLMIAVLKGDHKLIEALLHAGADPEIKNKNKVNPIHYAIGNEDFQLLKLLLAKSPPNTVPLDEIGYELFFDALEDNDEEIILAMLEHFKIDFDKENKDRDSIFIIACKKLSETIILKMLNLGASIRSHNCRGLQFAILKRKEDFVFQMLTTPRFNQSVFLSASRNLSNLGSEVKQKVDYVLGTLSDISFYEKNPQLINTIKPDGLTSLQEVIKNRNFYKAKCMIMAGANVDLDPSNFGTPLMLYAENGDAEFVDLLLRYGANIILKNKDGKTAIDMARENGHTKVVRLLENAKNIISSSSQGN